MKVIGTAGHIDHGKSTLVRHLTGIDPDRLAEEKARGMTIDLGFAWLTLPSGERVSIVDVPGHERFVKNMLAGAVGIDVALLVVAADESVMPQTREHVAILDLLGVERGVVALTKADLVETEMLQLVADEVAELLSGTPLHDAPIQPVSSVTGEGIQELLALLDIQQAATLRIPGSGNFYLPIDRVFHVKGFGTVVTGTMHGGNVRLGDEAEVVPRPRKTRVRGLQVHNEPVLEAGVGARVAVNLAGISHHDVERGDMLAVPGTIRATTRFVARLRVLSDCPHPITTDTQVAVHLGSAERAGSLRVLGAQLIEPGDTGWIRIVTRAAVPALRGQSIVVRMPAPGRTVAGGHIADVAPRDRRWDEQTRSRLEMLLSAAPSDQLIASVGADRPRSVSRIATLVSRSVRDVSRDLDQLAQIRGVVRAGDDYIGVPGWQAAGSRVLSLLRTYHAEYPLQRGMSREDLRSRFRWTAQQWNALLQDLTGQGFLHDSNGLVALPRHQGGSGNRPEEANRLVTCLERSHLSPPTVHDLLIEADTDHAVLSALIDEGRVIRLTPEICLSDQVYRQAVATIVQTIQEEGNVGTARTRDILNSSRKIAVALLEYLDACRITARVGDTRILGSRATA